MSDPILPTVTAPQPSVSTARIPLAGVDPIFVARVSPRAFQTKPLPSTLLRSLFEAARWSPSAANNQPWLFLIADSEPLLTRFRSLLNGQNRRWADNAPVLAFVLTQKQRDGKPNRTAEFDAGAAWMSLALQATSLGLRARAMGGIRIDAVYDELHVPRDTYQVLIAVAIGHPAAVTTLPEDLRAREVPTQRKTLDEIVRRGTFDDFEPL